jgi:hypothetical protein
MEISLDLEAENTLKIIYKYIYYFFKITFLNYTLANIKLFNKSFD